MLNTLKNLDRRIIYVFILLSVLIPMIYEAEFPIKVSPGVEQVVKTFKDLKPGSTILLSADYDPGSQAELQPMTIAILKYCFANDINVITMGLWPQGHSLVKNALNIDKILLTPEEAEGLVKKGKKVFVLSKKATGAEEVITFKDGKSVIVREDKNEEYGKFSDENKYYVKGVLALYDDIKYGVDYLEAGYKLGAAIFIQNIATDFAEAIGKDLEGKPVVEYPIAKHIKSLKDVDLVFTVSSGTGGIKEWVIFGNGKTGVKVASGVTAVSAPEFLPYVASGQLEGGMLAGLAGAAEFETGTGFSKGEAIKGMGPQSYAHLTIILFIILGNAVYIWEKMLEGKK